MTNAKILGVGPRTAAFLKETYARPRAKLIARDFDVSVGTAERWLSGEAPTVAHIEQMTGLFGEEYVRAVFIEAFERQDYRIRLLEDAVQAAFAAGGAIGVVVGAAHAYGLLEGVKRPLGGWFTWAGQTLGLIAAPPQLHLEPDPARTVLINGLIETVALLPAPGEAP
jgi:hypothetical protein